MGAGSGNPFSREQKDRDLFDRIASAYARKDTYPPSAIARQAQLRYALEPVLDDPLPAFALVDLGCGVGAAARYLHGVYGSYIGIDQSGEMIRAAEEFHRGDRQIRFIHDSVRSERLPRRMADVVLADGALHHMSQLDQVMEAVVRIARPSAWVVVREPLRHNAFFQMLRRLRQTLDRSYSPEQHFFSETELRELFRRAGIREIDTVYFGFFSTPFAQVILRPPWIFTPLSRLAVRLDRWLERHLPLALRRMAFNVVVRGRVASGTVADPPEGRNRSGKGCSDRPGI